VTPRLKRQKQPSKPPLQNYPLSAQPPLTIRLALISAAVAEKDGLPYILRQLTVVLMMTVSSSLVLEWRAMGAPFGKTQEWWPPPSVDLYD